MRKIGVLLLIFLAQNAVAQNREEIRNFTMDVLRTRAMKYSKPKVISKIDSGMVEYHLAAILDSKDNLFPHYYYDKEDPIAYSTKEEDRIQLTNEEKEQLIAGIRAQYQLEWDASDFDGYELIALARALPYLEEDRQHTIAVISRPVFIREGTVALAFFLNLCCGHIYGFVELSFYKKVDGKWQNWVFVSGGDY